MIGGPWAPGGSRVKNPSAMQVLQETWVQFLGREDPLEEGMVTHFSILAWRIPWTEEPGWLQSTELDMTLQLTLPLSLSFSPAPQSMLRCC